MNRHSRQELSTADSTGEEQQMFTELQMLITRLRAATARLQADDRGYSTETVVITAALVLLAIAVVAIITAKVVGKANGINI